MNSTNPKRKSTIKTKELPIDNLPTSGFLNEVGFFWLRFDRFGWDILGVAFITLSLITLLGLQELSSGKIITPWIDFLKHWLGWGSYFFVITFALFGLISIRKPLIKKQHFNLWRILSFELLLFSLLAYASILGGHSLEKADMGLDGGVIGWGLAEIYIRLIPIPWNGPILIILILLLIFSGSGISSLFIKAVERWLYAPAQNITSQIETTNKNDRDAHLNTASITDNHKDTNKKVRHPTTQTLDNQIEEKSTFQREKYLPPLSMLLHEKSSALDEGHIHETAIKIEKTLSEFGIPSRVVGFRVGPTITQFAVEPGFIEKTALDGSTYRQKIRISQISTLSRDLALALSAKQLRIEAPVPGHSFVGIEAPNPTSTLVRLRPLLESEKFHKLNSPLAIALGRNVSGQPVVADLSRMPHLLIAGTTGSGKSICIQAISTCLAMNNSPETLRLVMLDPKMVELVRFNGLPHLFGNVETELDHMLAILKWALVEMDNRYRLLETAKVRDIEGYNRRMEKRNEKQLPRIVIFIDELADLMMSAPEQTEHSLVRLAQMARATGIHMIVATQRPSTDVVTGLIKANFPARVSFNVASAIDSRVILDTNGAENLLGHGDMLFLNPETGIPVRAQGVMITDQEIEKVIKYWQTYVENNRSVSTAEIPWESFFETDDDESSDQLLQQAIDIIQQTQRASASLLQRRLRIGYPRAARLIDELEEMNIIGPSMGGGKERDVLIPPDEEDEESSSL